MIEAQGTKAEAVAHRAGLDPSTFSRLINGSRALISIPSLVKIADALCKSKQESAELIAAHLRDQCQGPGAELISIKVNGKQSKQAIPSSLESALEVLRATAAENPRLRDIVLNLAKLK